MLKMYVRSSFIPKHFLKLPYHLFPKFPHKSVPDNLANMYHNNYCDICSCKWKLNFICCLMSYKLWIIILIYLFFSSSNMIDNFVIYAIIHSYLCRIKNCVIRYNRIGVLVIKPAVTLSGTENGTVEQWPYVRLLLKLYRTVFYLLKLEKISKVNAESWRTTRVV